VISSICHPLFLEWIANASLLPRQPEICRQLVSIWLSKQHTSWRFTMYHKVRTPFCNISTGLINTSTACQPLQNAFEFDSLSPAASIYSYCALMTPVSIPKCNACVAQMTAQNYTNNCMSSLQIYIQCPLTNPPKVVTALNGACQQQPIPGKTISLQGSLFSTTPVNITAPSATPSGTYTPSNSSFPLGAKIGVAVGGLVLLLSALGACIIWRGKRRRRSFLLRHQQQSGYAEWVAAQQNRSAMQTPTQGFPHDMREADAGIHAVSATSSRESGGVFFDSPLSQRPLVSNMAWGNPVRREDESPAEKVYFSPYTSQYNSPVSATDQIQMIGQQWPMDRKGSTGEMSRFGSGTAKVRQRSRSPRREKQENHFELQNVAPVLHHPGHGRQGSNNSNHSARSLGLTEEDHKRGDAV
jgi:hypothetical protein